MRLPEQEQDKNEQHWTTVKHKYVEGHSQYTTSGLMPKDIPVFSIMPSMGKSDKCNALQNLGIWFILQFIL